MSLKNLAINGRDLVTVPTNPVKFLIRPIEELIENLKRGLRNLKLHRGSRKPGEEWRRGEEEDDEHGAIALHVNEPENGEPFPWF